MSLLSRTTSTSWERVQWLRLARQAIAWADPLVLHGIVDLFADFNSKDDLVLIFLFTRDFIAMGQLLGLLTKRADAGGSILVDFASVPISPKFNSEVLSKGAEVLSSIENYQSGAKQFVKQGMEAKDDEERIAAFRGVLPYIAQIKSYYDFSILIASEEVIVSIAETLLSNMAAKDGLEGTKTQIKQLATILDFALRFDQTKMHTPQLLNDFSFYRRTFPRMVATCDADITVRDVEANKIAMFMAHQVPMINCICEVFQKRFQKKAEVIMLLADMANILCRAILNKHGIKDNQTKLFCCRAMTGAIVLYDHVDPNGVFCTKSKVQLAQCVKVLRNCVPPQDSLLGSIQYSSRHFKDSTTPAKITKLFS